MSTIAILSYPGNFRVTKIQVAAKYANVTVTTPEFNFEKDNISEAYLLNCHPLGKVPVAKTDDGYLFESNAIARYVARLDPSNSLYGGGGAYEASQVDQWIDFTANEVETAAIVLAGAELGFLPKVEAQQAAATTALQAVFATLNTQLEVRTFLVGERISLADIVLGTALENFFRVVTDKKFKEGYVNLLRYVDTVINQPNFAAVLAALPSAKAPAKGGDAKAAKDDKPKADKPKAEKAEKPKAEEKPKTEKPKAEKKPKDDEDDDEGPTTMPGFDDDKDPEIAKRKAMKTALETLPPSVLNLDEFKRCYSNNDTRTIAAPFLFEKYDPAGYTCMWSSYKYNSELSKMVFMTANLIGGMFQRMDALHKFVFGSVVIIGTETAQEVHGFWIFRGQGMPGLMACVDDVVHHDWVDIPDLKAQADRITDFLACDGKSFEKKPVLEYKIFK